MLERVPASAESAGLFLLRRLERQSLPLLRSGRALDPHFWHHGARDIESPTWWSSYLQAVRVVPQPTPCPARTTTVTRARYNQVKLKDNPQGRRRRYTNATTNRQETLLQTDADFVDPFFPKPNLPQDRLADATSSHQPHSDLVNPEEQDEDQAQPIDRAQAAFVDLVKLADAAEDLDRDAAWKLFIRLEDHHRYASDMLYFLSPSKTRRHLLRGHEAFQAIARSERSERDYESIIRLELARFRHRAAITLAIEGTAQGFHLLPALLAYFVNNSRWTAVAQLIQSYLDMPDSSYPIDQVDQLPDHLLQECFALDSLPKVTLELAQRLTDRKAVDAQRHHILVQLCRTFMRRCVMHPDPIRLLTPSTMTSLFEAQSHFGDLNLHSHAITTLSKLPERAAMTSMALLALRDWVARYPDQTISTPILGSLIVMCDEARLSPFAYQYLIDQWRRCHGKPDLKAYQRILTGCARLGNAEAVDEYLNLFQQDHGPPTNLAFLSPLIYVRAVAGDAQGAAEAFHRIRRDFDLIPNRICWNMLMYAYFRSGDTVACFGVFEDMVESGIQPSSHSYGILLAVSAAIGDIDATLSLLNEAQEKKLHVTTPMLGCLVEAHLKDNNVNAARHIVFALSESDSSESPTRLWNSLLRHHALKGDYESVLQTQKRMRHFLVEPDDMTYATLLTTLTMMHKTKEAVKLLHSLRSRPGIHVTAFHYAIILHGYVREGNVKGAKKVYEEMKEYFPDLNASARKSMLTLKLKENQAASNLESEQYNHFLVRHGDTIEYLASLAANVSDRDLALKSPSPGFLRTYASQGLVQQYLESMLASFVGNGSYDDAQHFLASYDKIVKEYTRPSASSSKLAIQIDTLQMDVALQHNEIDKVLNSWDRLFHRAVEDFASLESRVQKQKLVHDATQTTPEVGLFTDDGTFATFSSGQNSILASHRYDLSKPLSIFIEAMAKKKAYTELFEFIEGDFIRAGFRLSNSNLNRLVQLLCLADKTDLRIRAFKIAERVFSQDFDVSPWKLLKRGKMILPKRGDPKSGKTTVVKRTQISMYNPSVRVATYLTWNYLAYAIEQAQRKAEAGDRAELQTLLFEAARTIDVIQHPAGLKHRAADILLHDSAARGVRTRQLEPVLDPQVTKVELPWRERPGQAARNERSKLRSQNLARKRAERHQKFDYRYAPPEIRFRRYQEDWLSQPLTRESLSEDADIEAGIDAAVESSPALEEKIDEAKCQ